MAELQTLGRYLAEHRDVLLEGPGDGYPRLLAVATTPEDAEKIARALNQPRGAVDALEFYADYDRWVARPGHPAVANDGGQRARDALDRLGRLHVRAEQ